MMDPNSGTPIIILKDVQSDTMLPIWVGAYEANAIALEIEKIAPPRPMTHDLLRNLIVQLGVQVERVVVTSLRDNTFFAVIEMRNSEGNRMVLDSRPSDAIGTASVHRVEPSELAAHTGERGKRNLRRGERDLARLERGLGDAVHCVPEAEMKIVAAQLQHPIGMGGEPVVIPAVQHDRSLRVDAARSQQASQITLRERIAAIGPV